MDVATSHGREMSRWWNSVAGGRLPKHDLRIHRCCAAPADYLPPQDEYQTSMGSHQLAFPRLLRHPSRLCENILCVEVSYFVRPVLVGSSTLDCLWDRDWFSASTYSEGCSWSVTDLVLRFLLVCRYCDRWSVDYLHAAQEQQNGQHWTNRVDLGVKSKDEPAHSSLGSHKQTNLRPVTPHPPIALYSPKRSTWRV